MTDPDILHSRQDEAVPSVWRLFHEPLVDVLLLSLIAVCIVKLIDLVLLIWR